VADPINEAKQKLLDHRNEWRALLAKQAEGHKLGDDERKRSEQLAALIPKLEQAVLDEQKRLDAMDAKAAAKAAATGYTSLGLPYRPPTNGDAGEDAPAVSSLPPLPTRTRAALARLYPQASTDPEQREQNWRGVVAAALGGMPLHPAVLAATATEGVPSDGGFLVTPEVSLGIFTRAVEASVWLRIGARLETMASDELVVNAFDDSDETDDAEATIKAAWTDEASEASAQTVKFRQVTLKARKLLVLAAASNELAEDSPGYVMALEGALSRAIGKRFDRAVLSGTGAGNPLGILNSAATITVSKEGGQPASTFKWENTVKMWSRLAPGAHERSWWLMHPTVLPQALSMSLAIGTGGTQPRAAFEAGGVSGYMLLGRPVLVTSRVKVLGTKGDVILCDPSQLAVGVRRGITIDRSEHAFFSSDRLAIRGKFRGDARPVWDKARTLVEGSTTVSPYVVLEAR